jgi:hypothetical protein
MQPELTDDYLREMVCLYANEFIKRAGSEGLKLEAKQVTRQAIEAMRTVLKHHEKRLETELWNRGEWGKEKVDEKMRAIEAQLETMATFYPINGNDGKPNAKPDKKTGEGGRFRF